MDICYALIDTHHKEKDCAANYEFVKECNFYCKGVWPFISNLEEKSEDLSKLPEHSEIENSFNDCIEAVQYTNKMSV